MFPKRLLEQMALSRMLKFQPLQDDVSVEAKCEAGPMSS